MILRWMPLKWIWIVFTIISIRPAQGNFLGVLWSPPPLLRWYKIKLLGKGLISNWGLTGDQKLHRHTYHREAPLCPRVVQVPSLRGTADQDQMQSNGSNIWEKWWQREHCKKEGINSYCFLSYKNKIYFQVTKNRKEKCGGGIWPSTEKELKSTMI